MLCACSQPAIAYDLVGLASRGLVTVGRESEAIVRLDSPDVSMEEQHLEMHDRASVL